LVYNLKTALAEICNINFVWYSVNFEINILKNCFFGHQIQANRTRNHSLYSKSQPSLESGFPFTAFYLKRFTV